MSSPCFTAADLGIGAVRPHPMLPPVFDRPPLAVDVVRFVGDPVAVVVADTRAHALDAAELVDVRLEPLPVTVDPVAALEADAPIAFPRTAPTSRSSASTTTKPTCCAARRSSCAASS